MVAKIMSRTTHHRGQKSRHDGHDYGARYKCNKRYGQGYGKDGRDRAHKEIRHNSNLIIKEELDIYMAKPTNPGPGV